MAQVVVEQVLQVTVHLQLLAQQVLVGSAVAVAVEQVQVHQPQAAQEYFTFSTRRHYERNYL
jgi:translation initiation factor 6 (eIF-6)